VTTKKRVVVKVGSSSLASVHGGCDLEKLTLLVNALSQLKAEGHEVVLVSSGAVASGYSKLGYRQRPRTLVAKQAAAAIGQSILMQQYTSLFSQKGYTIAQILLTRGDFSDRERYKHAFETLSLLLSRGIIPIINENDTVSVAELTFGDNDMLGALVAGLIHADLYTILTDTDGFYDKDPRTHLDAKRIPFLDDITPEVEAACGKAGSLGTGGMYSKVLAGRTALQVGIPTFIGRASHADSLKQILNGDGEGTYIGWNTTGADKSSVSTRKQWIALHSPVSGQIWVDDGAAHALLQQQKSLLFAGVKNVQGTFQRGEVVEVLANDQIIGRGIIRFDSTELQVAVSSHKRMTLQGEVIHRDQWIAVENR